MPQDNPWVTYQRENWPHLWNFEEYHNPPKAGSDEPEIADVDITPVQFVRAMAESHPEDMRWSGHDHNDYSIWLCNKYGIWHDISPGSHSQAKGHGVLMEFMAETYSYIMQNLPSPEHREMFRDNSKKWDGQTWNGKIVPALMTIPDAWLLPTMPEPKNENYSFLREDGSLYTLDTQEHLILRDPETFEINEETRKEIREMYLPASMPRLPEFPEPETEQDAQRIQEKLDWLTSFYPDDLFYMAAQMIIRPYKTMGIYIKEQSDGGKSTFRVMLTKAFGGYIDEAKASETVSLGESSKYDNAKKKYSGGTKVVQIDEVDKSGISGKLYQLTDDSLPDVNPKYGMQQNLIRTANTIMYAGGPPQLDPTVQGIGTRIQFVVWDKSTTTHERFRYVTKDEMLLGAVQKMLLERAREICLMDAIGNPTDQMVADSEEFFTVNANPIEPALLEAFEEHPDGFVANSEIKEVLEGLPMPSHRALPKIISNLFPNAKKGQASTTGKPRGYFGIRSKEYGAQDGAEVSEPDPTKQTAFDGTGAEH